MKKNKKSSPDMHSAGPTKNHQVVNPYKRDSNPDDPSKEKAPRIKEMPLSDSPHHPHNEEILDGIPK